MKRVWKAVNFQKRNEIFDLLKLWDHLMFVEIAGLEWRCWSSCRYQISMDTPSAGRSMSFFVWPIQSRWMMTTKPRQLNKINSSRLKVPSLKDRWAQSRWVLSSGRFCLCKGPFPRAPLQEPAGVNVMNNRWPFCYQASLVLQDEAQRPNAMFFWAVAKVTMPCIILVDLPVCVLVCIPVCLNLFCHACAACVNYLW